MQPSPVLYVKVHLRKEVYLVPFMASALNCWRSYQKNMLDNWEGVRPYKRIDNLLCLSGWGAGDWRSSDANPHASTHTLFTPHTFSPYKPEDGVTTTGGELVLNSFLSLTLTFWWVKLRSVWIKSRQGMRQTLQCRNFLHCKRNCSPVFWHLCKRFEVHTVNAKCIAFCVCY